MERASLSTLDSKDGVPNQSFKKPSTTCKYMNKSNRHMRNYATQYDSTTFLCLYIHTSKSSRSLVLRTSLHPLTATATIICRHQRAWPQLERGGRREWGEVVFFEDGQYRLTIIICYETRKDFTRICAMPT